MYDEPDWSSLSLVELLEKAQEFAKKAYGSSLSRSHRICQAPRKSYSEHTCDEKAVIPRKHTTLPLASGRCPDALRPQLIGGGDAVQAGS